MQFLSMCPISPILIQCLEICPPYSGLLAFGVPIHEIFFKFRSTWVPVLSPCDVASAWVWCSLLMLSLPSSLAKGACQAIKLKFQRKAFPHPQVKPFSSFGLIGLHKGHLMLGLLCQQFNDAEKDSGQVLMRLPFHNL